MITIRCKRLATIGFLALTIAPVTAQARDKNWYIGLRGGVVLPTDRRFFARTPTAADFITTERLGWAAAARLGYDFGRVRTELDFGYHQNSLRAADLTRPAMGDEAMFTGSPGGQMRHYTVMANALYDVINSDGFSLSVGGGAGAARTNAHNIRVSQQAGVVLNDTDWVFAWNALAGARVALGPAVDLAVDYRFLRPDRARLVDTGGQGVTTRNSSHTILVGLNINFGGQQRAEPAPPAMASEPPPPPPEALPPAPAPAPAPPPPPPAVAPPPGPVMLFFDFDSSDIRSQARDLISRAADTARQMGTATLGVSGHTDRAGSPDYNAALGQRRATAVQRELETMGIAPSRITIQSFGEDRPMVDTVDGQREPQNRRVEITIQPQ